MIEENRRNKLNLTKLFIIASLLFLLLFFFAAFFILRIPQKSQIVAPPVSKPFSDCKELEKDCQNSYCGYYSLCQWFAFDINSCQVYDCGSNYGLLIKDKENKLLEKTYPKPDARQVEKEIASCSGGVNILSRACVGDIQKLTLKVNSGPDCPAEAFLYQQKNIWQIAEFANQGPQLYLLKISSCAQVSGIKAVGKKGILIGEAGK